MSKEMRMADVFDGDVINDADTLMAKGYGDLADFSGYKRECRYAAHAINNHDRLVDEVEAMREALRLKEAECESLAGDKQQLINDCALCVEELKAWADEYDDSDSNLLIEKVQASLAELGGGDEK